MKKKGKTDPKAGGPNQSYSTYRSSTSVRASHGRVPAVGPSSARRGPRGRGGGADVQLLQSRLQRRVRQAASFCSGSGALSSPHLPKTPRARSRRAVPSLAQQHKAARESKAAPCPLTRRREHFGQGGPRDQPAARRHGQGQPRRLPCPQLPVF
jgi:hypothetical protein